MATCNDCIHSRVCVILACPDAFENTKWDKEPCDHFKSQADVVEVVRCKECKHATTDRMCDTDEILCSWSGRYNDADGFCNDGERKEQT